jgi:hypothetical protein
MPDSKNLKFKYFSLKNRVGEAVCRLKRSAIPVLIIPAGKPAGKTVPTPFER